MIFPWLEISAFRPRFSLTCLVIQVSFSMIKTIQFTQRFTIEAAAHECLYDLQKLEGYLGGRAIYSPSLGEAPYLCQAFFEYQEQEKESIEIVEGLRVVWTPENMLK